MGVHADAFAPLRDGERYSAEAPQPTADWRPVVPVPPDASGVSRASFDRFAPDGHTLTKVWTYRGAGREVLGYVARYERPVSGKPAAKTVLPLAFCEGPGGRREWRAKAFAGPRPLYNMDVLAARPEAPVLLCEGEKSADAAARIFPGHVATTSPGGSNAADKADWTPLAGRHVVIWPDNDESGAKYACDVADLVRHAGAASVAMVALPAGLPQGWDLADELPDGLAQTDLAASLRAAPDDGWPAPDLSFLASARRPAPPFPTDLLGPWDAWVKRAAAAASAPVDFTACALLASAAAMIGNVRWPLAGAKWREPPALWCALVAPPSLGKSPAIDPVVELVRYAEEQMAAGFDDVLREYELKRQISRASRSKWEGEVKAAVDNGELEPPLPQAAIEPEAPERPRLRVKDVTVEKLGALAAALPRGLLQERDELSAWIGSFDRYGGGSDRSTALEMYGGRRHQIDRVKRAEPIIVEHFTVGVLGGTQPDKLPLVTGGAEDGFAARFVWSFPGTVPAFRLSRASDGDPALDEAAKAAFARLAGLPLGADDQGRPQPKCLRLTPDAEDALEEFAQEMVARGADVSGLLGGAIGKARGHVLRLSCVLEHLHWCATPGAEEPALISLEAVQDAAALMDSYFLPMAERVFSDAAIPPVEQAARALARHLRRERCEAFNARALRRAPGSPIRDPRTMDAACRELVEGNILRSVAAREGLTKGRASKDFEVNPAILAEVQP